MLLAHTTVTAGFAGGPEWDAPYFSVSHFPDVVCWVVVDVQDLFPSSHGI